jgi:hypothetical protein
LTLTLQGCLPSKAAKTPTVSAYGSWVITWAGKSHLVASADKMVVSLMGVLQPTPQTTNLRTLLLSNNGTSDITQAIM